MRNLVMAPCLQVLLGEYVGKALLPYLVLEEPNFHGDGGLF